MSVSIGHVSRMAARVRWFKGIEVGFEFLCGYGLLGSEVAATGPAKTRMTTHAMGESEGGGTIIWRCLG
jgi:hypothetical protein